MGGRRERTPLSDRGLPGATVHLVGVPGQRAAVAAGVGVLALSWLLLDERSDLVPGWEVDLFDAINGLPDGLRWPVWGPMQLGNFWMGAVGAAAVYGVTRRVPPAVATGVAGVLAWGAAKVVKNVVERGRPAELVGDAQVREAGIHGEGFVSGHVAVAFALAAVVAPLLPRGWRWTPYALAGLVGLARIYYGAHLPLDVIGGGGLGVACGALVATVVAALASRRS